MTDSTPAAPDRLFDRTLIGASIVVILGAFMTILDTTIVNVAIDSLSRQFHSPLSTIQWVSTGYLLALATVIPLTGWAADRFGTKRLYMISIALFVAGSALAGAANSAGELIAFRIIQGLGGGMVMPAGMTILSQTAGPSRVGRVMSVVGIPMLMGPVIGPILGGWLVDDVSWRWIFYVNVPIGAIALLASFRLLPSDVSAPHERLDWRGLLLLSPGLTAFVYGLAETSGSGGLGATSAWLPMLAGVLFIAAFIFNALRTEGSLIDLSLWRNTVMRASSAATFLLPAAMFGAMLMIPLYYQVVRGQSALHAGLLLAPQGIGAALMMPLAGRITDRRGAGRIALVTVPLLGLGLLGFTQISATTPFWVSGALQFVIGLGMGGSMMPSMSAAYQTLKRHQVARATTALNIIMRVGSAVGTALLSVVLTHQLASKLPGANGESGLGAAQSVPPAAREKVAPLIADAFGHTFWWSVGLVALGMIPVLFLPRHKPGEAAPAADAPPPPAEPAEAPVAA
jgi:EmrB/QacA subfamily drug resistance transporter